MAAQRLLGEAIAAGGVPYGWDEVVRPVLCAIAQRWANAGVSMETEHLLYECVLAALIRATPLVTEPCSPRPVLFLGGPGWRVLDLDPRLALADGLGPVADAVVGAVR